MEINSLIPPVQEPQSTREKKLIFDRNDFLQQLDYKLLIKFQISRSKFKTGLFYMLSFFGLPYFWAFLGVLALTLRLFHAAIVLLITGLSGLEVIVPLKKYFKRKRPYDTYQELFPIKKPRDYSFPSGHTFCATVNSFSLVICFRAFIFFPLAFLLVFLVGCSRMYYGVHYLSDVYVGFFLGILIAGIVVLFFPYILVAHQISLTL